MQSLLQRRHEPADRRFRLWEPSAAIFQKSISRGASRLRGITRHRQTKRQGRASTGACTRGFGPPVASGDQSLRDPQAEAGPSDALAQARTAVEALPDPLLLLAQ